MNALVTGGSRGIGAAIARQLAEAGHQVVLSYKSEAARADEVVEACKSCGAQAIAIQADVSREEDCTRLVAEARQAFGPVGILVNNAGMTRDGLVLRMSLAQFSSVIEANLTGTFLMCRLVLADMVKARQGRIVNISSISGLYGNAGQVNYSASKAGVIGLTRSLAKEVGSRNITVNAIAPGFIETDMTRALPEAVREAALKSIALGRFGQADDVAAAVLYLVSPGASYITGQVLEVSGGLTL
jgi:3-oxoacyl-[acyl-carrier protein] reductase